MDDQTKSVDQSDRPLTEADIASVRPMPRARRVRHDLRLSPEEFSARYRIPLDVLKAWETGQAQPDAANAAYLEVIAREPETVRRALMPS